jgi:hypothetical protein
MPALSIFRPRQQEAWRAAVTGAWQHDLYHLPEYHALAEERGEGQAHCFVYAEGEFRIALPLLLRPLASVPGLSRPLAARNDATSVYGYAGPVASHPDLPPPVLRRFGEALARGLRELGVVSVFSRLHPLLPQTRLLEGLGECRGIGQTVSIDLTARSDEPLAWFHRSHRHDVRRQKRRGLTFSHDEGHRHLPRFIQAYRETMRRVGAADSYFFDDAYFANLVGRLAGRVHLLVVLAGGEVICGGLFTACDGIAQYHLTGTLDGHVRQSPAKVLIEGACWWARAGGLRVLHLGGGVGSAEDSLFAFKAGFSDRRHRFFAWRWVVEPDVYRQLCQESRLWRERQGTGHGSPDYFPAYRCPPGPSAVGVGLPAP